MAGTGAPRTGGRQKGSLNKVTRMLKDDILTAAEQAHPDGRVGYLVEQAQTNPSAFLTLLGKILPSEVNASVGAGDSLSELLLEIGQTRRTTLSEPARCHHQERLGRQS